MIAKCVCYLMLCFFFFKQKQAYEVRVSDWSSDVCSSDLPSRGTRSISRQPSNSLIELETFERARPSTSAISSAWSGRSEMKSKAWICATERLTPHCPPRLPQWRMNSVAAGDRFAWASLISVITEISGERSVESRGFWQCRFVGFSPDPTVSQSRQPT